MPSPIQIAGQFYNVGEEFDLYDTIIIRENLDDLSIQPPGWYASFAAAANAQHSFFNVRNRGNCELAYCNLDSRDTTAFAFQADEISCSFWAGAWNSQRFTDAVAELTYERLWLPNAIWQGYLPFEASLTLRVQQDDKTKLNCLMASPGYGPVGGGFGNIGASTECATAVPNITFQTQGEPTPAARIKFPNVINIPRRASLSAEVNFTQYARNLLGQMPGPGTAPYFDVDAGTSYAEICFGITVTLHGRRLVQQRGELHA